MKKLCTSGSKACLFPPAVGQGQTGLPLGRQGFLAKKEVHVYMGIALHVLKPEI